MTPDWVENAQHTLSFTRFEEWVRRSPGASGWEQGADRSGLMNEDLLPPSEHTVTRVWEDLNANVHGFRETRTDWDRREEITGAMCARVRVCVRSECQVGSSPDFEDRESISY